MSDTQVTVEKETESVEQTEEQEANNQEQKDEQVVRCHTCDTKLQHEPTDRINGKHKVVNPVFNREATIENIETGAEQTVTRSGHDETMLPVISAMQMLEQSVSHDDIVLDGTKIQHYCDGCAVDDVDTETNQLDSQSKTSEDSVSTSSTSFVEKHLYQIKFIGSMVTAGAIAYGVDVLLAGMIGTGLSYHSVALMVLLFAVLMKVFDSYTQN